MTRKIGSIWAGPDVDDGAGENIAGKDIMMGMIIGMAISLITSFLRVADRISLLSIAPEGELRPRKPSRLGPDTDPAPAEWSAAAAPAQYLALEDIAVYESDR